MSRTYWMNIWRAGGVENDQRGAWSAWSLRTVPGAPAGWLTTFSRRISPEPNKAVATDEILVIPTTTPLHAAEAAAISTYWQSVWLADGDAPKSMPRNTALDGPRGRRARCRPHRVLRSLQPVRCSRRAVDQERRRAFGCLRCLPSRSATNLQSWSQAPQVRSFPIASSCSASTEARKLWRPSARR